ncbi:MAG: hypothetical protein AAGN82_09035, partial [Myxococcota bacterium]
GGGVALNETGFDAGRIVLVAGFPIAFVGLFLAWRVGGSRSSSRAPQPSGDAGATAVAQIAAHLGLRPTEDGAGFRGTFRERTTELFEEASPSPTFLIGGPLVRPLDAGLTVTRGKPPGDARRESKTGDASFDAVYAVRVDEPERATALLSERLRRLLLEGDYRVDDQAVWRRVPRDDAATIEAAAVRTLKVAAEVERVAGPVPCAQLLRSARDAFARYAIERRLAIAETPLAMWGTMDGVAVTARAVRDAFQQYHYEIDVTFAKALGRGLFMGPASSSMQHDRGVEPVGHPKFDKHYVLKADPPEDAPRLIGRETRKILLALRERGVQVRVRDHGVWAWVGFHREQTDTVLGAVGELVVVASRIEANAARYPLTASSAAMNST